MLVHMRIATLALVAALFAGCAGNATPASSPATSTSLASIDPASEDGRILVTVVTTDFEPVQGAQVLLAPLDRAALTGPDGVASFDELPPGEYTVIAAKPGFKAQEARGKIARVEAGQSTEIRLSLDPVRVVRESYHFTYIFRGFVSCSFAATGTASTCGRGLVVGTTPVRDPNENSTHEIQVTSIDAASAILEAKWQPTIAALPAQGYLSMHRGYTCTPSCSVQDQMFGGGGNSPLRVTHSPDTPFSNYVGRNAADYPKKAWVAMRATCTTGCTAGVMLQQPYDAYATIFYGEPAPVDFRVIPT